MELRILSIILSVGMLFSACRNISSGVTYSLVKADTAFLDSVIKRSDTSFIKKYKRPDFVTAEYYLSRQDSTELQVMRDSLNKVRQVIMTHRNVRSLFAQYYENGQLQANLSFDSFGQYNGPAIYYYQNGAVKSEGNYMHGLSRGEWREFDETGKAVVIKYDANGARIN